MFRTCKPLVTLEESKRRLDWTRPKNIYKDVQISGKLFFVQVKPRSTFTRMIGKGKEQLMS